MKMGSPNSIYKVRFFEKDKTDVIELQVRSVEPSEFPGLICFKDLVFEPAGAIIRPDLDKAHGKFSETRAIHVPYHNILYIEEITAETSKTSQASAEGPPRLAVLKDMADDRDDDADKAPTDSS